MSPRPKVVPLPSTHVALRHNLRFEIFLCTVCVFGSSRWVTFSSVHSTASIPPDRCHLNRTHAGFLLGPTRATSSLPHCYLSRGSIRHNPNIVPPTQSLTNWLTYHLKSLRRRSPRTIKRRRYSLDIGRNPSGRLLRRLKFLL